MDKIYSTLTVKAENLETGKIFNTELPAYSEANAKQAFFACYRHGKYKILKITSK